MKANKTTKYDSPNPLITGISESYRDIADLALARVVSLENSSRDSGYDNIKHEIDSCRSILLQQKTHLRHRQYFNVVIVIVTVATAASPASVLIGELACARFIAALVGLLAAAMTLREERKVTRIDFDSHVLTNYVDTLKELRNASAHGGEDTMHRFRQINSSDTSQ